MPFRRRKMTREKTPISDYLVRFGVVLLLFAILLLLMVWLFSESAVFQETSR